MAQGHCSQNPLVPTHSPWKSPRGQVGPDPGTLQGPGHQGQLPMPSCPHFTHEKPRLRDGHHRPTDSLSLYLQVKALSVPGPPALVQKRWEFHFRFQPDFYSKEQQLCTHLSPKLGNNFLSESKMVFCKGCGFPGGLSNPNSLSSPSKATTVGPYLPQALFYRTLGKWLISLSLNTSRDGKLTTYPGCPFQDLH